jgi:Arc/MetJ family transcription regulator
MRTTVSFDDELLATAEQLTNVREKSALLREALKAFDRTRGCASACATWWGSPTAEGTPASANG